MQFAFEPNTPSARPQSRVNSRKTAYFVDDDGNRTSGEDEGDFQPNDPVSCSCGWAGEVQDLDDVMGGYYGSGSGEYYCPECGRNEGLDFPYKSAFSASRKSASISFVCPDCGDTLDSPTDDYWSDGYYVECKHCGASFAAGDENARWPTTARVTKTSSHKTASTCSSCGWSGDAAPSVDFGFSTPEPMCPECGQLLDSKTALRKVSHPDDEYGSCPRCGEEFWMGAYSCPYCGYGADVQDDDGNWVRDRSKDDGVSNPGGLYESSLTGSRSALSVQAGKQAVADEHYADMWSEASADTTCPDCGMECSTPEKLASHKKWWDNQGQSCGDVVNFQGSKRKTADAEMTRTRVSVPRQLEEAGHTLTSRTGDDGLIVYIVDGEEMGLGEAADRYLPGGWAESFGRSGSRRKRATRKVAYDDKIEDAIQTALDNLPIQKAVSSPEFWHGYDIWNYHQPESDETGPGGDERYTVTGTGEGVDPMFSFLSPTLVAQVDVDGNVQRFASKRATRKTAVYSLDQAIQSAQADVAERKKFNDSQDYQLSIEPWLIYYVPTQSESAYGVIYDDAGGYRLFGPNESMLKEKADDFRSPAARVDVDGNVQRFASKKTAATAGHGGWVVNCQDVAGKYGQEGDHTGADCSRCGGSGLVVFNPDTYAVRPFDKRTGARKTAAQPSNVGGRDCDPVVIRDQIGMMNVLAISGGRWSGIQGGNGKPVGIELPVAYGYKVRVYLADDDTYTVQRVHRDNVKGEIEGVYADMVGEMAYQASCFQNVSFGGHVKGGSRKTAVAAGYYLLGPTGGVIAGPFATLVEAEGQVPATKASAVEYKSGIEDPEWEAYKAKPFPYTLNTVNG